MSVSARRVVRIATVLSALLAAAGCASRPKPAAQAPREPEQLTDMRIVDAIGDSGVRAAIVTQHTLFPYHFGAGSFHLNELGEDDLAVLISNLRTLNGGELNVRRGDASDELYTARVHFVEEQLRLAGIDLSQVKISDGVAAGTGMASVNVMRALQREAAQGSFDSTGGSNRSLNLNLSGNVGSGTSSQTGAQP